jgi:transposase
MKRQGNNVEEIDKVVLNELIARVEHAIEHDLALSVDDMKLLLSAITTLCTLQEKMEQDDVTLHKLHKLLGIVKQSESRSQGKKGSGNKKATTKSNNKKNKRENKKPTVAHHGITDYQKGQCCPDCGKGKLYKYEPGKLLRITGHAPYEATLHITEQLRCNGCQGIYKAPLPAEVLEDGDSSQMYGYSARSLMVIDKFYSGLPYNHQSNLSDIFGCSVSASTIFDQCEQVANAVMPVYYEFQRLGANAHQFLLDDTRNRILTQQPELKDKRNGKGQQLRTGIYSSGLIAQIADNHEIVLFQTSLGHAGEHLDSILKKRNPALPPPRTMSDALSSNSTVASVVQAYCNAHCRRLFYDLAFLYPTEVEWVLETYSIIWKNEKDIREEQLNEEQGLAYHKEHSLPVMESLKAWAIKQQSSSEFEEHSAMGKAIKYLLRHYNKLILFCVVSGTLIDNNRMEEKLKIVIRGRKTAHFYKTPVGAQVANVLVSLIATADGAGANVFDYLMALQKNHEAIKRNPNAWLPWNYHEQLGESPPHKNLKSQKAA